MFESYTEKQAKVLVNYSLDVKPGQKIAIESSTLASELMLAIYKEVLLAGAHPHVMMTLPGQTETLLKHGANEQIEYVSPIDRVVFETFDAHVYIEAPANTRQLSAIAPEKHSLFQQANAELLKLSMAREAAGEFRWCYTLHPANALAQEADMSLTDYANFVYRAMQLDQPDPVAAWQAEAERQRRLIQWLAGRDEVVITGKNVDLRMSIKGRSFLESAGTANFPSGEIYTSPVETSANGWIRFSYPAIFGGREVEDIQLWFEDGKVVKEQASKGQNFLTTTLNTDAGARYLGELGIGTNYNIQQFTKNMLFDEKIGGTIHLAMGFGFPEAGAKNESAVHWDMLCNMDEGQITIDGDLFYQNGHVAI